MTGDLTQDQRKLISRYLRAMQKSDKASKKAADDFGAGRRRSTTNAANWAIAAEERDRLEREILATGVTRESLMQMEDAARKEGAT